MHQYDAFAWAERCIFGLVFLIWSMLEAWKFLVTKIESFRTERHQARRWRRCCIRRRARRRRRYIGESDR